MLTRDQCLLCWGQTGPGQEPVRDQDQDIHPDSGDTPGRGFTYQLVFTAFYFHPSSNIVFMRKLRKSEHCVILCLQTKLLFTSSSSGWGSEAIKMSNRVKDVRHRVVNVFISEELTFLTLTPCSVLVYLMDLWLLLQSRILEIQLLLAPSISHWIPRLLQARQTLVILESFDI